MLKSDNKSSAVSGNVLIIPLKVLRSSFPPILKEKIWDKFVLFARIEITSTLFLFSELLSSFQTQS